MTDEQDREEEVSEPEMPDESDVQGDREPSGTYPCPYCGAEVYEEAIRCPHCQRYVSRPAAHRPGRWIVLGVLLAIVALVVWLVVR